MQLIAFVPADELEQCKSVGSPDGLFRALRYRRCLSLSTKVHFYSVAKCKLVHKLSFPTEVGAKQTAKCLASASSCALHCRQSMPACVRHAVLHCIRIPHLGRSPSCPCQITNIECEAHWLVVALSKEIIIFDRRQRELRPCHTIRTLPPPKAIPDLPLRTKRPLGPEPKREA